MAEPNAHEGATRRIAIVEDPRYAEHAGPEGHPERPERLTAVHEAIEATPGALVALDARPADDDELLRVHGREHLAEIGEAVRHGLGRIDADTYVSSRSLDVARLAAGASIDLARAVARRDVASGLAAVRPPGHHAEAGQAMGFCLFNNVAIAARALQATEGVERVAILDWDVHHGNGTQHSFESDPSVLYFSSHQFPYYPGTGAFGEMGIGRGEGVTLNVPLPAGAGDPEYVGVFQRVVVPALQAFRPECILVSAGFDAHRDDPLAAMEVSGAGYAAMTGLVLRAADELCGGRVAFILEGGYALSGLRDGVAATLAAAGAAEAILPPPVPAPEESLLGRVIDRVVGIHGSRIPGLGAA